MMMNDFPPCIRNNRMWPIAQVLLISLPLPFTPSPLLPCHSFNLPRFPSFISITLSPEPFAFLSLLYVLVISWNVINPIESTHKPQTHAIPRWCSCPLVDWCTVVPIAIWLALEESLILGRPYSRKRTVALFIWRSGPCLQASLQRATLVRWQQVLSEIKLSQSDKYIHIRRYFFLRSITLEATRTFSRAK